MSDGVRTSKRPALVWFISAFYIMVGLGSLAFCDIAFMAANLPSGYLLVLGVTAALTLFAAVALLLLRRQAFHLFALALLASVIMYAWPFWQPGGFPGMTSGRILSTVVGLSLMIAVLLYSRKLKNVGILR
jgi:hypothetical protein